MKLWMLAGPLMLIAADAPIAHFYYMDDVAGLKSLQANYSRMSIVSPVWYIVDSKGDLRTSVDRHVLAWAGRRVRLMPVVMNDQFSERIAHGLLSSSQAQEKLAAELVESAAAFRLYGLQLDFENIPADHRDDWSRFVQRVCEGLSRSNRICSVAVPAPLSPASQPDSRAPKWDVNDRSAAFDYAALGRTAQFLSLMAYDEYTSADQPGPIAGAPWVEACLRKALDLVPAEKLLLGIPLYSRRWAAGKVSEGPLADAALLAGKCNALPRFDSFQQEWTATCGRGSPATVWYHDASSLRKRLELVKTNRLAGFSAWRLGQEGDAVWKGAFRSFRGRRL